LREILYEETKGQYIRGKYKWHIIIILGDLAFIGTYLATFHNRIDWSIEEICVSLPFLTGVLFVHILLIIRLFARNTRLQITPESIVEGNWNFSKNREIFFEDIEYVLVDTRWMIISIFDKEGRRVMAFGFISRYKYWDVLDFMKELKIRLKKSHKNEDDISLDKSVLELYKQNQ